MKELLMEIDVAEIVTDIVEELHGMNQKLISNAIVGETCGFEQKDGTFALYVTHYEKLKDLKDKNFSQVPEWYWEMVHEQAMELFAKLVGKYLERNLDRFGNKIKNQ